MPATPMQDLLPPWTIAVSEEESVTLEEVPLVTENAAGRQEGRECNRHIQVKHKLLQARHLPRQHRLLLTDTPIGAAQAAV